MIHHQIQGERVPALGFGTFRLQGDACREGVADALRIGYRHVDTAQGYDNEAEVGAGIRDAGVPRAELFLVSKVRPSNFARGVAKKSTLESLKKLGTDHIDLMLLHWPSNAVPLEEPLQDLADLQREGAVRHVGVSNFPPTWLDRARAITTIFCDQVEYHPFLSQERLLQEARDHDLLLTAYRPLAGGKLDDEPVLREIADAHGKSPVQVTLRWLVQQDRVATIPKSADPQRRRQNFDIWDFTLSPDEMARIHALDRGERQVNPDGAPDWER